MSKRISVRGIIFDGDYVYTIFRRKINSAGIVKEYYVIPSGGIKNEETLQETVKTGNKRRIRKMF